MATFKSHPTWVRGLKSLNINELEPKTYPSHPTWVRGLKLNYLLCII